MPNRHPLSDRIVAPLGLESQPYYVTGGHGSAFVLGGLNMTVRDHARFGRMYPDGGRVGAFQVVPADWVEESTRPRPPAPASGLGYQWWAPKDLAPGKFFAERIYGQYVSVNRAAGVVIAVSATDRDFRGRTDANIDLVRRIAAAGRGRVRRPVARPRRRA